MSTVYYQVDALDTLMLRGNRSFGDAGDHGEAVMPPWPSVFAGAFRSAVLGRDVDRLAAFSAISGKRDIEAAERASQMRDALGGQVFDALGTPQEPGAFRLSWLSLLHEGRAVVPLPADLLAVSVEGQSAPEIVALDPAELPSIGSHGLPLCAVPRMSTPKKPSGGVWLDESGFAAYVKGKLPAAARFTRELYSSDMRLGIGIDVGSRTVQSGALYTTETVSFTPDTGFIVGIDGLEALLPDEGVLRLGGDGKGARYCRVNWQPPVAELKSARFRLVLATPAVFAQGWLPNGVSRDAPGAYWLNGDGFRGRLVCAAVPRHEVVSGWDLAAWQPKTAQRVVPAGSVYWFDDFEGEHRKLASWVGAGIWGDNADRQRRAEGFNLAWLGEWR